ncbi:MAG: hypothetical protein U9N63_05700 [Pseudomonadota bacterium]|nr:hypothetical protein [Pseudomonadota bacterium]
MKTGLQPEVLWRLSCNDALCAALVSGRAGLADGPRFSCRKEWILEPLHLLSVAFAFDLCAYAIMSNYQHLILRNRPNRLRKWTRKSVARRWLMDGLPEAARQAGPGSCADTRDAMRIFRTAPTSFLQAPGRSILYNEPSFSSKKSQFKEKLEKFK